MLGWCNFWIQQEPFLANATAPKNGNDRNQRPITINKLL
jgi:hypothetical protein